MVDMVFEFSAHMLALGLIVGGLYGLTKEAGLR